MTAESPVAQAALRGTRCVHTPALSTGSCPGPHSCQQGERAREDLSQCLTGWNALSHCESPREISARPEEQEARVGSASHH